MTPRKFYGYATVGNICFNLVINIIFTQTGRARSDPALMFSIHAKHVLNFIFAQNVRPRSDPAYLFNIHAKHVLGKVTPI